MDSEQKLKEATRLLCDWNRREKDARAVCLLLWKLYETECLETWNDLLEKLLV